MEILLATVWRILSLLFFMFVIWGFLEWANKTRRASPREFRDYLIAAGLGTALIPASCFVGLILSPRSMLLGSWSNHPVASWWASWNLPLAVLSVVLGIGGKGRGRLLLVIAAGCLLLVWTAAMIHWTSST